MVICHFCRQIPCNIAAVRSRLVLLLTCHVISLAPSQSIDSSSARQETYREAKQERVHAIQDIISTHGTWWRMYASIKLTIIDCYLNCFTNMHVKMLSAMWHFMSGVIWFSVWLDSCTSEHLCPVFMKRMSSSFLYDIPIFMARLDLSIRWQIAEKYLRCLLINIAP